VNSLGLTTRTYILDQLACAQSNSSIKGIILVGENGTFSAGADIREFSNQTEAFGSPMLTEVVDGIENFAKPIVAAIEGVALGGGCEVALASHFRVAKASARFGLPEVNIGLVPGAGGTQRLPRLVAMEAALDMMLTGKMISATKALELGLVDAICGLQEDLLETAVGFLTKALQDPQFHLASRRASLKTYRSPSTESIQLLKKAEKDIQKRWPSGNEPKIGIIKALEAGMKGYAEGLREEQRIFMELISSSQSRARRYLFFSERKTFDLPKSNKTGHAIKKVGVIGAGTMGSGIAICLLRAGYEVVLVESNQQGLERGLTTIKGVFMGDVSKGRLTVEKAAAIKSRLVSSLEFSQLSEVDMVIEAVYENMALKKEIFARLDTICPSRCILCSNTSTLDIDEIASATSRPQSVVGMHFFSPAHLMRLCEIIRGNQSCVEALSVVMQVAKKIGKVAVLVGNCHGFVANRMFFKYASEAQFMVEEGCSPEQIDRVMRQYGFAIGPMQTGDVAGLDIQWKVRQELGLTNPSKRDPKERWCGIGDMLCELGRLGQKVGKGWYVYNKNSFTPNSDPELTDILARYRSAHGIIPRSADSFTDQEILERCLYPVFNEGLKILEEGIASKASDIDVIWAYGFSFPVWKGGPMFQADEIGLEKLLLGLKKYHELFPNVHYWRPAKLFDELVKKGNSVLSYRKSKRSQSVTGLQSKL